MSKRKLCTRAIRFLHSSPLNRSFRYDVLARFERAPTSAATNALRFPGVGQVSIRDGCSNSGAFVVFLRQACSKSVDGALRRCWNCGSVAVSAPFLVCQSCRSVQAVDHAVDYFQIFGLQKDYDIKEENLEQKYKDWQKKLHPDLVHSKSEQEKSYAAEQSARVIDAYCTLNKPLSRALYLLKLEGVQVDEEKTIHDAELLAEMMEIREAVDEANSSEELHRIRSQIQQKLEAWSNSTGNALKKRDFGNAKTSIQRMTYYERAIEEIVRKL